MCVRTRLPLSVAVSVSVSVSVCAHGLLFGFYLLWGVAGAGKRRSEAPQRRGGEAKGGRFVVVFQGFFLSLRTTTARQTDTQIHTHT